MDKREIIRDKFNPIFCEMNAADKRYSSVWLSFANFGKVYFTDDLYDLKIKMRPGVEWTYQEYFDILKVLSEKAKSELRSIWIVRIINAEDDRCCKKKDVLVYREELLVNN